MKTLKIVLLVFVVGTAILTTTSVLLYKLDGVFGYVACPDRV